MEHRFAQMRRLLPLMALCFAIVIAGCGDDSSTTADTSSSPTTEEKPSAAETGDSDTGGSAVGKTKPTIVPPQGAPPTKLVVNDLEEGTGPAANAGDEVTVNYVGVDYKTGKQFDASWDRGQPFTFRLGSGKVIPGWEQGVEGMKAGGRRELIIPPELAYGSQSVGSIAPNSTLVFVIDLVDVK